MRKIMYYHKNMSTLFFMIPYIEKSQGTMSHEFGGQSHVPFDKNCMQELWHNIFKPWWCAILLPNYLSTIKWWAIL